MAIQQSTASLSNANALAADARTLDALKLQSGSNSPAAIKETAKQFESLFMRELLKSMRDATMKSGLMDSPGGDLGADLLDQQWAVQMSGRAGGLSEMIAAQLSRQTVPADGSNTTKAGNISAPGSTGTRPRISPVSAYTGSSTTPTQSQSNFVQQHNAAASRVEQASGIPASYMLGQAGHETGWGKSEIRHADGSSSFNLFGIKAGSNWTGKVAEVTTTEYVDGVAKKTTAKFRAYDSYEDSFRDYARLINTSPRYAQAREQTSSVQAFASGLQKAGYATDPDYASKLSRAISTTQRLQRTLA